MYCISCFFTERTHKKEFFEEFMYFNAWHSPEKKKKLQKKILKLHQIQ